MVSWPFSTRTSPGGALPLGSVEPWASITTTPLVTIRSEPIAIVLIFIRLVTVFPLSAARVVERLDAVLLRARVALDQAPRVRARVVAFGFARVVVQSAV